MWGYIRYLILFVLLVCIGMVSIHLYHDNRLENKNDENTENVEIQKVLADSNQEEPKGEVIQEEEQEESLDTEDTSSKNTDNNDSISNENLNGDVIQDNSQDTSSNIDNDTETSNEEEYVILEVR